MDRRKQLDREKISTEKLFKRIIYSENFYMDYFYYCPKMGLKEKHLMLKKMNSNKLFLPFWFNQVM